MNDAQVNALWESGALGRSEEHVRVYKMQRYGYYGPEYYRVEPNNDGDLVAYEDHVAAITELESRVRRLQAELARLEDECAVYFLANHPAGEIPWSPS